MLFDPFLVRLHCSIAGRREGGLLEEAIGLSPRAIKRMLDAEDGELVVARIARERTRTRLMDLGFSLEEASNRLAEMPGFANARAPTGSPLAWLASMTPGSPGLSLAVEQGARLDTLCYQLRGAFTRRDLDQARSAVAESGLAKPEWFAPLDGDVDLPSPPDWITFNTAQTWEEITGPLRTLAVRALFDWLACWDLDFCSRWLPDFEPRPAFLLVAPQLSARLEVQLESTQPRRALIDTPTRRLLDMTSALLARLRSGRWPRSTPRPSELANWANENPGWLAKVSTGERPLPYSRYVRIWEAAAASGAASGRIPMPPFPLFAASVAFEILFVQRRGGVAGAPLESAIVPGPKLYREPWARRLEQAASAGFKAGSTAWPRVLAEA